VPSNILIVEDDSDVRVALADVLADAGFSISCAADGRQGLSCLKTADRLPDLILLDLLMPRADGFQFRKKQLKKSLWARIPVVVLTADTHLFDTLDQLRAAAYIRKPVDVEALIELIHRLLGTGTAQA
jgi:two-component system, chemotaxis family, chemotaxis protein CheY